MPTFETLLAAGAKMEGSWLRWVEGVENRSVQEKERLAEVLRRYGARE